jgi:hypothetical protein
VIEGLKIDMTADELVRHLDERIRQHHERATECETRARRVEMLASESDDDEEGHSFCWPGVTDDMQRRATRHRDREAVLVFFRNHVIAHEIYRLDETDLRSLELLPLGEGTLSN